MTQRILSLLFALIGWFSVITQYYLMVKNTQISFGETTIRFFSFFTILTNILVAVYFTFQTVNYPSKIKKPGILTAITIYILIVGSIYQIILRSTWNPTGLQRIVDELLHTIIPVLVLMYWYMYENKRDLSYQQIPQWAVYPLLYLFYILIRGHFSEFYPYPFVNVLDLGYTQVLINSFWILVLFIGISMLFVRIGKAMSK
ncbi:Pr6Pr family membrane protein [Chryseobacterium gwangjuense]|uniref:Pr6Pr family membrane protein n=1 Tax=Chryseobacterium gwangjuense TaxID=1069980 RepID=UPI001E61C0D5|nr:Pr6Pr family membrane protein [Chryseobacterium gwangjuense]MCE3076065.1 Pr6Pr family membrane protein [Chryseobacterium gwangjuense]